MPVAERMTATEFLALPMRERGRPASLVEGEVVLNEATWLHNARVMRLFLALADWSRERPGRGTVGLPLDVRLDELNVYAPDVLWYAEGRAPGRHDPRPYPMPDLAVEVRSPSTWRHDVGAKRAGYERHGLPELWLVDTAADTVLVHRRAQPTSAAFDVSLELARSDELASPRLPGFALSLSELFD